MTTRSKSQRTKSRSRKRVSAKTAADDYASGRGSSYLKIPEGLGQFSPETKKYRLDFFYYVAGKGNPTCCSGDEHFERKFFVHKNVGPDNEWFVCPARTLKRPCPICEYLNAKSKDDDLDPDEYKQLKKDLGAKERRLYLVRDLSEGTDSPILFYNESVYTFGEKLFAKINNADEEDGYEFFADPEEGLTVRVSFQQSKAGKWLEVSDLELRPRKHSYNSSITDEMPCLDDMLVVVPYERLKKSFLQIEDDEFDDADDDDGDDGDKPVSKSKPKPSPRKKTKEKDIPTAEDTGIEKGDTVEYEEEECTVIKISRDGTSLTLKDSDGDVVKAVGVAEVNVIESTVSDSSDDDDDDDVVEEKPKPSGKKRTTKPKEKKEEKEPEPESDDDDDDDDNWGDFGDDDDDD